MVVFKSISSLPHLLASQQRFGASWTNARSTVRFHIYFVIGRNLLSSKNWGYYENTPDKVGLLRIQIWGHQGNTKFLALKRYWVWDEARERIGFVLKFGIKSICIWFKTTPLYLFVNGDKFLMSQYFWIIKKIHRSSSKIDSHEHNFHSGLWRIHKDGHGSATALIRFFLWARTTYSTGHRLMWSLSWNKPLLFSRRIQFSLLRVRRELHLQKVMNTLRQTKNKNMTWKRES